MDNVLAKSKTGRRIARNVAAGLCGFAAALALALLTVRAGGFVPVWFSVLVIYGLPLPVACGLAVGFVSPKKLIAWAPLWSCIFAVLISSMFCGAQQFADVPWSLILVFVVAGALLAALAGYAGQQAAHKGYVAKSVVGVVVVCCAAGAVGYGLMQSQERAFLRVGRPQILLELDRDFLALPRGMGWSCGRDFEAGSYVLTSRLNGQPMRVYAHADATALRYVDYSLPGGRADLRGKQDALRYLKSLGIRDPFVSGLSTGNGCWRSVLRDTQLTVWPNGRVRLDSVPPRAPTPAPKGDLGSLP